MRLINKEKLRQYAIEITGESEFAFDNCFPYWQFSKAINDTEEVEAIPVEWLKKWANEKCDYDIMRAGNWENTHKYVNEIIKDWEKENEVG